MVVRNQLRELYCSNLVTTAARKPRKCGGRLSKAHKTSQLCQFRQLRQFRVYAVFFCATVCKTARHMLSDRCLSCPVSPVCNVGVLWKNSWTDQDETWHASRPRPWPHCVRWGPSSFPKKGEKPPPQFSAHVHCGQTAGWIKMALGVEVGVIGAGHIVLDGDPAPLPKKGQSSPIFGPFLLWPNSWMHQNATWYAGRPLHGDPAPCPKGAVAPKFRPMSVVAKRLDSATWYGGKPRPRRHYVRCGPISSLQKNTVPNFQPMSILWPNGCMH